MNELVSTWILGEDTPNDGRHKINGQWGPTITLENLAGVDNGGVVPINSAWNAAIAELGAAGGGTILGGGPGSLYRILGGVGGDLEIPHSNITVDLRGGTFWSPLTSSLHIIGTKEIPVRNITLKNIRFGTANDAVNLLRGLRMTWARHFTVRDVLKQGMNGTSLSLAFCNDGELSNTTWNGAGLVRNTFGALTFHCSRLHFKWLTFRDGPLIYGIQIKGGEDNVVEDGLCSNLYATNADNAPKVGFRDRGDAPWKASASGRNYSDAEYPYEDGSWYSPDERRASNRTRFIRCRVEKSPTLTAFAGQECVGTVLQQCSAANAHIGFSFKRTDSRNGSAATTLSANAATGDREVQVVTWQHWEADDPVCLLLADGTVHATEVRSRPSAASTPPYKLPLMDALPSPATSGAPVAQHLSKVATLPGATQIRVGNVGPFHDEDPIIIIMADGTGHATWITNDAGDLLTLQDPIPQAVPVGSVVVEQGLIEDAAAGVVELRVGHGEFYPVGGPFNLRQNDGTLHSATITAQDGQDITINFPLSAAADAGNGSNNAVIAAESDLKLLDCDARECSSIGTVLLGVSSALLQGATVRGGLYARNGWDGIAGTLLEAPTFDDLTVRNNNQEGMGLPAVKADGIVLSGCIAPLLTNIKAYDNQVAPTQAVGIRIMEESCLNPRLIGNDIYANRDANLIAWLPGLWAGNASGPIGSVERTIGDCSVWSPLDQSYADGFQRWLIPEGAWVSLRVALTAQGPAVAESLIVPTHPAIPVNRAYYELAGLFYRDIGSGTVQQWSTTAVLRSEESSATYDAKFTIVSPYVRLAVRSVLYQRALWAVRIIEAIRV